MVEYVSCIKIDKYHIYRGFNDTDIDLNDQTVDTRRLTTIGKSRFPCEGPMYYYTIRDNRFCFDANPDRVVRTFKDINNFVAQINTYIDSRFSVLIVKTDYFGTFIYIQQRSYHDVVKNTPRKLCKSFWLKILFLKYKS